MNVLQVISSKIIKESYLKYECSKEVVHILSMEPEFDWQIITRLNLSLLNLVHIVGLRLVTNVKCLILSHNLIKKIENLDCLVKLEELDLSNNRITVIENLDHLTNLNDLNLSCNKISELNNLDNNSQLQAFSIRYNEITDINQIFYLKRFKYLQYMGLSNNPATNDKRQLIIDQFPKLIYLDNKIILAEERSLPVETNDEYNLAGSVILGDSDIIHKAFLNETDGITFFNNYLYCEEVDGEMLSKWNSTVGAAFATYKKQINDSGMELFNTSLQNLTVRDEIFSKFKMSYNRFEKKLTYESRDILNEFEEIRKIRKECAKEGLNNYETDENSGFPASEKNGKKNYNFSIVYFITYYEDEIMELKMKLHKKNIYMNKTIMDLISKYTMFVEEELKSFLELLVPIFYNMREIVSTYSEILNENIRLAVNNPIKVIPKEFINHFGDRFVINDAAVKMSDKHMEMIYKREEKINSDVKKWAEKSIEDLKMSEMERFWMVFEEVTKYSDNISSWLQSLN